MISKAGVGRLAGTAILLLVCCAPFSLAQSKIGLGGGINFFVGLPQGEFKEQVPDKSYGVSGEFLFSPSATPIGIGAAFGYGVYGSESRREPFSTTIPDVTVNVKTNNNILLGHFILRIEPKAGVIRPYAEGLVGFNYLFTETTIEDADEPDEEVASSTNFDDGVFSYGGGGGVHMRVYEGKGDDGRPWSLFIDLGAHYIKGGRAEYLKEGSVHRRGTAVAYDVIESRTDLVTTHVGIAASF